MDFDLQKNWNMLVKFVQTYGRRILIGVLIIAVLSFGFMVVMMVVVFGILFAIFRNVKKDYCSSSETDFIDVDYEVVEDKKRSKKSKK